MRRLISSKRCAEPLGLGRRGDGSVDVDGSSTRFGCRLSSTEEFFRNPSEEFGIAVRSVGILTRTRTHLRSLTTSTPELVGVTFFFGLRPTPPLLPLVRDPHPATPLGLLLSKLGLYRRSQRTLFMQSVESFIEIKTKSLNMSCRPLLGSIWSRRRP